MEVQIEDVGFTGKRKKIATYINSRIRMYESRFQQADRKIVTLAAIQEKMEAQKRKYQRTSEEYGKEQIERKKQIQESDEVLKAFRKSVVTKNAQAQVKYKAMLQLEENIKVRATEVDMKIRKIHDALLEWHAASQIVSEHCQTSVYYAAEKFHKWHQTVPSISSWLANEGRVRGAIYGTAAMMGLQEELLAHDDLKKQLQEFAETHYKDVSQQSRLPPLKQINEQRQHRSEQFDQLHTRLTKQLRTYVRSCEALEYDIVQKEQLRLKLNAMAMEISNSLTEDMKSGLVHCEIEARRKIEFILQVFSQVAGNHPQDLLSHELLEDLRNRAQTKLEMDVLEQASSRFEMNKSNSIEEQASYLSSLSGSHVIEPAAQPEALPVAPMSVESAKLLQNIKKPFAEIKTQIRRGRAPEVVKARVQQLKMLCDNYNPRLRVVFDQIRTEREEDEDEFDPDHPIIQSDESPEVVNSLSTLFAVKTMQLTAAESVSDSVSLLKRLLENAKKEEESVFDLHGRPGSGGATAPPPVQVQRSASAMVAARMEQQQSVGYRDLQKKVARQFRQTQLVLEQWLFDKTNADFNTQKTKLISALRLSGSVSADQIKRLSQKPKVAAISKVALRQSVEFPLDAASVASLPYPTITAADEEAALQRPNDETEEAVKDMLSLSEVLLVDLEKQLQTEISRNQQEAFSMQQIKKDAQQRPQQQGGRDEEGNSGVVVTADSEAGDILLATAEIIMHNDLYHISLVWRSRENMATFVARNLLPKRMYKEYIMNISLDVLSEITGMNIDNVVQYILNDTQKAFQQITHHIQVEEIRPAYYEELKEIFDNGYHADLDILMYLPHYLPFGSEIFHHNTSNQMESNVEQARGLLLKVMTCRADHGGLLLHCFAQIRSMRG